MLTDSRQLADRLNQTPEDAGKPAFRHLLGIAANALWMWPPAYVQSFLGPYRSWFPPFKRYSEFTIINLWELRRTLKFLVAINFPSISGEPWPLLPQLLTDLVWQPTQVLQRPDNYDNYTSFPEEQWFLINGIMTNTDLAQLNAACLAYLFHRPITLIQNSTDGVFLDLLECSLGKEWFQNTESATIALPVIYDALKNPHKEKVVIICHSQGTIITAVLLRALKAIDEHWKRKTAARRETAVERAPGPLLAGAGITSIPGGPVYVFQDEVPLDPDDFEPLTDQEWGKLEIYCFANCANEMRYHAWNDGCPVPWIESFGNERDLVARLGMLAPHGKEGHIHIDGPMYLRKGAWGHLLNHSYLLPIAERQKNGRKRGGASDAKPFTLLDMDYFPQAETPRLYSYINGGSPGERPRFSGREPAAQP